MLLWSAGSQHRDCMIGHHQTRTGPLLVTPQDCLLLNVWTPRLANLTSPVPVMLFIHGGNFKDGCVPSWTWLYNQCNKMLLNSVMPSQLRW
jgi:carboxylesterase type B